ncbi:MAG TPA: hemerythrin domain-containing protein [Egibacteraceae bacterium]|jgi:hemerythrin superfamily protein|nr:hemerythrin domain-containing protein [Egibacteraceae bacterium]
MAEGPDALDLIAAEHRMVEDLFCRFENATEPQEKTEIVHEVIFELVVHGEVEEIAFYLRLRESLPDGNDLADEAIQDHMEMKETINALDSMTAGDDCFDELMRGLMAEVRDHFKEEEAKLFPKVREAMTNTGLRKMGGRIMEARSLVPTRPHPSAPTGPLAKTAAGPPVTLVEWVRDALRSVADDNR